MIDLSNKERVRISGIVLLYMLQEVDNLKEYLNEAHYMFSEANFPCEGDKEENYRDYYHHLSNLAGVGPKMEELLDILQKLEAVDA
jgi:hypothetical protein